MILVRPTEEYTWNMMVFEREITYKPSKYIGCWNKIHFSKEWIVKGEISLLIVRSKRSKGEISFMVSKSFCFVLGFLLLVSITGIAQYMHLCNFFLLTALMGKYHYFLIEPYLQLYKHFFMFLIFLGWQPRWFVLDNGILSYYDSQDDVCKGSKGSIKMAVCEIKGKIWIYFYWRK